MIIDGTTYNDKTPSKVAEILESIRKSGKRFSLSYGDSETGRDWLECYDIVGRIGRSMGPVKIPLMIANSRSSGGCGILDHCIVRIRIGGTVVWQHEKYHQGVITLQDKALCLNHEREVLYPFTVFRDGQIQARFRSELARSRYVSKLGLKVTETGN